MSTGKESFIREARIRFLAYTFYDSIKEKDLKSIKYLLEEKKANPNYVFHEYGISPLHMAAGLEDESFSLQVIEACLEHGGDPNVRSSDGMTPVHVAAYWKRAEGLRLLIEAGGDIYLRDDDGFTSLDYMKKSTIDEPTLSHNTLSAIALDDTLEPIGLELISQDCRRMSVDPSNSLNSVSLIDSVFNESEADIMNDAFVDDEFSTQTSPINDNIFSDVDSEICYIEVHCDENAREHFSSPMIGPDFPFKPIVCPYKLTHQSHENLSNEDMIYGCSLAQFKPDVDQGIDSSVRSRHSTISSYYDVDEEFPQPDVSFGSHSSCPTEELKTLLKDYDVAHGPIVKTTKRVYLYQLKKLKHGVCNTPQQQIIEFNDVVLSTFNGKLSECISKWASLETKMIQSFKDTETNKFDNSKQYFTYLLLDPTLLGEVRMSHSGDDLNKSWTDFLKSVFYIGKGKNARPLDHLLDAVKTNLVRASEKIKKINDIWSKGFGVVCIHIFHYITETEALTREACMISALSNARLTNVQNGRFYGDVQKWSLKNKRQLGVVLIYRSMMLLLAEGERQVFPSDLKK